MKMRSDKRQRTEYIRARVTPEEKLEFQSRCQRSGITAGDYIRQACLDQTPLRAQRQPSIDRQLLAKALGQLMRYGNNLNQIARKFNQNQEIHSSDREALHSALQALHQLRTELRQALGYDSQR